MSSSQWRSSIGRRRLAVTLVGAGMVIGALLIPPGIALAKQAIQEVIIANTAANPVPVTGSVAVTGTVSVADERETFEVRVDLSLADGEFNTFESFTVPAGKRLVVEFLSVSVRTPQGQTPLVSANANSGALGFAVPLIKQGNANGAQVWGASFTLLDFAPAGSYLISLSRQAEAGGPVPGAASAFAYVSGYLEPA